MNIILGLGNPGKKYHNTPHNTGFFLVDGLARTPRWKKEEKALTQSTTMGGFPVLLAKPTTYVNLSGKAARSLLFGYRLSLNKLVVIVDDANLNLGGIRIRQKGSDGGHNGLKSIIENCGSNFTRIRIGIGKCPLGIELSDFVLRKFNKEEASVLLHINSFFNELIQYGLEYGWTMAASKYNRTTNS